MTNIKKIVDDSIEEMIAVLNKNVHESNLTKYEKWLVQARIINYFFCNQYRPCFEDMLKTEKEIEKEFKDDN